MADLTESLRKMMGDPQPGTGSSFAPKKLSPPPARPDIPARTATFIAAPASSPGGGGIDSPITENNYALREYYEQGIGYQSSDGLFFMPAIKKLVMHDVVGREVTLQFAEPT